VKGEGPIVLVGLMGSGKTTVGAEIARRLGCEVLDTDEMVEAAAGCSVPELIEREGIDAFRGREAEAVDAALRSPAPLVISTGGGAVESASVLERLRAQQRVAYLELAPELAASRVGDGSGRPLLEGDPAGRMAELHLRRHPLYLEVADVVIDAAGPVDEVADAVLAALGVAA
jgi:shikimate kinase